MQCPPDHQRREGSARMRRLAAVALLCAVPAAAQVTKSSKFDAVFSARHRIAIAPLDCGDVMIGCDDRTNDKVAEAYQRVTGRTPGANWKAVGVARLDLGLDELNTATIPALAAKLGVEAIVVARVVAAGKVASLGSPVQGVKLRMWIYSADGALLAEGERKGQTLLSGTDTGAVFAAARLLFMDAWGRH